MTNKSWDKLFFQLKLYFWESMKSVQILSEMTHLKSRLATVLRKEAESLRRKNRKIKQKLKKKKASPPPMVSKPWPEPKPPEPEKVPDSFPKEFKKSLTKDYIKVSKILRKYQAVDIKELSTSFLKTEDPFLLFEVLSQYCLYLKAYSLKKREYVRADFPLFNAYVNGVSGYFDLTDPMDPVNLAMEESLADFGPLDPEETQIFVELSEKYENI